MCTGVGVKVCFGKVTDNLVDGGTGAGHLEVSSDEEFACL